MHLYETPAGLVATPEEAEAICARLDMDYNLVVRVVEINRSQASYEAGPGGWIKASMPVTVY